MQTTTNTEYVVFTFPKYLKHGTHPALLGFIDETSEHFWISSFPSRAKAKAYAEEQTRERGEEAEAVKVGSARYKKLMSKISVK
jgi:hypothetical protein